MVQTEVKECFLRIENLTVELRQNDDAFYALQNVSFEIEPATIVALVGESGCGKTMIAKAILGLLPKQAKQLSGSIIYNNILLSGEEARFKMIRGNEITMIFQEPTVALNPVFKIGHQLADVIKKHQTYKTGKTKQLALEMLKEVGLPEIGSIYNSYAHQLSGGMAQRVLIALALSCNPSLLIADEPTTALDATTQVRILRLLKELQQKRKFSMLIISHDMKVVSALADSIIVLKDGRIIDKRKMMIIRSNTFCG